jgi:hypothetical protein
MGNTSLARRGWIASSVLVICVGLSRAADAPSLKYALKPGQTYTYQVKIEAQTPEYLETLSGESIYKVKSVEDASGRMTLTHSATLMMQRKQNGSQRPMRLGPPPFGGMGTLPNYNQPREVTIDPLGGLVKYESKAQLPYLLGSAFGLMIEPLAEKPAQSWQVKRDLEISSHENQGLWLPRPLAGKEIARMARETIDYAIKAQENGLVSIERRYLLATADLVDGEPALEQKGNGTIQFDTKTGLIRSLEEKLTIRMNDPGVTVKIPVSVSAKLLTAEDLAKLAAQRKEEAIKSAQQIKEATQKSRAELAKTNPDLLSAQDALEKASKSGADAAELQRLVDNVQKAAEAAVGGNVTKAVDDAGVDAALAKLKQADRNKVMEGEKTFAVSPVIPKRRAEVAKALGKLLSEPDHFVRTGALKALSQWGTADNVPALIALVDDENPFVAGGAMDALAAIKDERGAEAIAKQLPDFKIQHQAKTALIAMGPISEKYVLPLLKNKEYIARSAACEVLAEVGTVKSIEPLKEAVMDRNFLVQQKAADALRAVEGRQK